MLLKPAKPQHLSLGLPTIISFVFLIIASAQQDDFTDIPFYDDGDLDLLFLGNSYTGYNNLPAMTREVLENGIPEWGDLVDVDSFNPGGYTLGKHLANADGTNGGDDHRLRQQLVTDDDRPEWKWVVLQDQSQTPGFWEIEDRFTGTLNGVEELNNLIVEHNPTAQTVFFMTWGRATRDNYNMFYFPDYVTMQEKLTEGYMRYVDVTSTTGRPTFVAPVGLVYETIYYDVMEQGFEEPSDEYDEMFRRLYQNDQSHPSVLGTYVTALTLYTTMTGRNPKDITYYPEGVDMEDAIILQDAVSRTIVETFEDGSIKYPFDSISWSNDDTNESVPTTPATAPPTTSSTPLPTEPPTTPQPTPNPTPEPASPSDNGNNNNNGQTFGSITVEFVLDDYPDEVAWTFMKLGNDDTDYDGDTPLFFQPFGSNTKMGQTITKTFDKLDVDAIYSFQAMDSWGDGICCGYGYGSIVITDNTIQNENENNVLFSSRTYFQKYMLFDFQILENGNAMIVSKTNTYTAGSWKDYEEMISPSNEDEWPGNYPTESSKFTFMINIDIDDHPEDISWILKRQIRGGSWITVDTWDGETANAMPGTLESIEMINLEAGWYKFEIQDSQENGLCCEAGSGYVSLTGPLRELNGDMGLIWGNNGQYLGRDVIHFKIESWDGYISYIRW